MSSKKDRSDLFTAGVDEIFRIANHIQGRMALYLAVASVLEERSHRTRSDAEHKALKKELTSLDILLHQLNDVAEVWDSLENGEIKSKFSEELAEVVRRHLKNTETEQDDRLRKPRKYKTVFTEPRIETSYEYLLRRITEER